jgi:hypothetical protein
MTAHQTFTLMGVEYVDPVAELVRCFRIYSDPLTYGDWETGPAREMADALCELHDLKISDDGMLS